MVIQYKMTDRKGQWTSWLEYGDPSQLESDPGTITAVLKELLSITHNDEPIFDGATLRFKDGIRMKFRCYEKESK